MKPMPKWMWIEANNAMARISSEMKFSDPNDLRAEFIKREYDGMWIDKPVYNAYYGMAKRIIDIQSADWTPVQTSLKLSPVGDKPTP